MKSIIVVFSILIVSVFSVNLPYTQHAILSNLQTGVIEPSISAPGASSAFGAAIFSLNPNTYVLDYTVVNNVMDTTAAHIHGVASGSGDGFPGVAAPVLVAIPGFEAGNNTNAVGSLQLTYSQAEAVNNGRCYVNIHTKTYPNGEIRGQILSIGQQVTVFTAASATSSAQGYALSSFDPAAKTLTSIVLHSVVNANGAYLQSASVSLPLSQFAPSSLTRTVSVLTDAQITDLYAGLFSFVITSNSYPNGELIGKIAPVVNFLAELTGAQDNQTTAARGVGAAALYNNQLSTVVEHTVPDATAAHIHLGLPGVAGPVIFPYASAASPIVQNFTATNDQSTLFANGSMYFNVHTTAAPNGLIRGQIHAKLGVIVNSNNNGTTTATTGQASTTLSSSTGSSTGSSTSSSGTTHGLTTTNAAVAVVINSVVLLCCVVVAML